MSQSNQYRGMAVARQLANVHNWSNNKAYAVGEVLSDATGSDYDFVSAAAVIANGVEVEVVFSLIEFGVDLAVFNREVENGLNVEAFLVAVVEDVVNVADFNASEASSEFSEALTYLPEATERTREMVA